VPAAHCGLYGLKGSVARLPHGGLLGSHDGMDAIVGCIGPLASSAQDLELFCRVMLECHPWLQESPLLDMPWKSDVAHGGSLPAKLSIAILFDDGVVGPHPPITDALRQSKDALIAAGHDVIEWQPAEHKEGWELIVSYKHTFRERKCSDMDNRPNCICWMEELSTTAHWRLQESRRFSKQSGFWTMQKDVPLSLCRKFSS
jgi:amidase